MKIKMLFFGLKKRMLIIHSLKFMILILGFTTVFGLMILSIKLVDPSNEHFVSQDSSSSSSLISISFNNNNSNNSYDLLNRSTSSFTYENKKNNEKISSSNNNSYSYDKKMWCASVEEMGEVYGPGFNAWNESLRVRRLIHHHFLVNGPSRVRQLPPVQFCRHGFVMAKASEAGFGNEMYKLLTAAALSVMLNRSLIIGQTRGEYPFGDYITYSNDTTFTLIEIKQLWKKNKCLSKYGRDLVVRMDDFQKPAQTNILCSNWKKWQQPIVWLQNTTDAVAAQFFLKNIHPEMRSAAFELFGKPELNHRPNVFGELMQILISPSPSIEAVIESVLGRGKDPDVTFHMRMLMGRSLLRPVPAALNCIKKAIHNLEEVMKPKVVLVSDTPAFIKKFKPSLQEIAEVLHFDYKHFRNLSLDAGKTNSLPFRIKDWGPAPRWVAFVDFFLASRAKHAVISGASRRVGTTYVQLIAALAAARNLDEISNTNPDFVFISSFQRGLLKRGLRNQIGWGHAWNRFAGPLSCQGQTKQCAYTPLLPPGWWDGIWQSPIVRDIRRLRMYGVRLSGLGTIDDNYLQSYCKRRKDTVVKVPVSKM